MFNDSIVIRLYVRVFFVHCDDGLGMFDLVLRKVLACDLSVLDRFLCLEQCVESLVGSDMSGGCDWREGGVTAEDTCQQESHTK